MNGGYIYSQHSFIYKVFSHYTEPAQVSDDKLHLFGGQQKKVTLVGAGFDKLIWDINCSKREVRKKNLRISKLNIALKV